MDYYGISDTGKVRKINQDVFQTSCIGASNVVLLVVCDGMGGAKAGNIASDLAAETFVAYMSAQIQEDSTIVTVMQRMQEAAQEANTSVYTRSMNDTDCSGMGTTLVAAAITASGTVILNVGDSRAYHVIGNTIEQVTKDHSVVEDMIDRGDITRAEASSHPNRNLITRALGTSHYAEPDFFFVNLKDGEYLLLCSDGLTNVLSEHTLLTEVISEATVQDKCTKLIELANLKGAPDNVTAVVLLK